MRTPQISSRTPRLLSTQFAVTMMVLCVAMPAYAGTSTSTMGGDFINMMRDVSNFLTGEFVIVGTIIFGAVALMYGWWSGGMEGVKKAAGVLMIGAAILSLPTLVPKIAQAAGALI